MIGRTALLFLTLSGTMTLAAEDVDSYLSYPLGGDRISVVYVMKSEETDREAKKLAMQKGSEMLCKKGYSYTAVVSEGKVIVMQAPSRSTEEYTYSDQYSRSIVQQNSPDSKPSVDETAETYPGYKVVMQGYQKNPGGKEARACSASE